MKKRYLFLYLFLLLITGGAFFVSASNLVVAATRPGTRITGYRMCDHHSVHESLYALRDFIDEGLRKPVSERASYALIADRAMVSCIIELQLESQP